MAIDNRLQVFNEEGQSVDYDILASDVKFLPDGKDLPTKLAEMDAEIENAGGGEGTVTGVKVGSDTYEPTEGVVDLSTPFSGKVDKNGTDSLMTAAEHTKLQNLPTADQLTQQMGTKANDNAVVKSISVNGTQQSKDSSGNVAISGLATTQELTSGLSGKQNTLTFDDAPTAGHTTQVMSSDSIKTALDVKADAADVPTKTEMSDAIDDAFSDAQVAVVPAGSIGVIDGMGSDSTTDALSANMGKRFKAAILTLLGSMGNYCFPAGKPQLILDGSTSTTFSVTYSQSDLHVTYADGQGGNAPSTVDLLGRLEIQLGTDDDLYVINESAVHVYVGGNEVSNAYDPTTDKIIIPEVYGNVVIVADSMTYVQDGLVLHLDCRHRGGTGTEVSGHWKSLVNYGQSPIDFTLKSGVTAADTGMVFDGGVNSYGEADTLLNILYSQATIECVASGISSQFNTVLVNPVNKGIGLSIHTVSSYQHRTAVIAMGESFTGSGSIPSGFLTGDTVTDYAMSVNNAQSYNKGVALVSVLSAHNAVPFLTLDTETQTKLTLGARLRGSGNNYLNGTVRAIRVYNAVLTAEQQLQNWIVDKKRFNIS